MEREEDARERRRAEQRALRGSEERAEQIRRIAEEKEREAQEKLRAKRSSSSSSERRTPENSQDYFGHPWPEWFAMRDAAFDFLVECARGRRTAGYGETWDAVGAAIGKELGSHWRELPNLLGFVSERSQAELGLLSTALVIYQPDAVSSGPGAGFFRMATRMGLLDDSDSPPDGEEWVMSERQRDFWQSQVDALFERFAT